MSILTIPQAIANAQNAGFTGNGLQTMVAIQICESGLNTSARGYNSDGTVDRGLNQINSYWHREVSNSVADNALLSTQEAYRISSGGTNFTPWSTFNNGCYKNNLAKVANAMLGAAVPSNVYPEWTKPFMQYTVAQAQSSLWHYKGGSIINGEGGVDFSPPAGTPITALADGEVVGAGYFFKSPDNFCASSYQGQPGWKGYGVVTTRITNVDGSQTDLYYQHIILHPSIKLTCKGSIGQRVSRGDVIGWVNPEYNIEIGVNVGSKWGTIWGTSSPGPHVDPIPYLHNLIASGGVNTLSTGENSGNSSGGVFGFFSTDYHSVSNIAHDTLNNVPGFVGIAEALDLVEQFQPFQLPASRDSVTQNAVAQGTQDSADAFANSILGPLGPVLLSPIDPAIKDIGKQFAASIPAITLPADAMQAGLVFIVANTGAFLIRASIVALGFIIVTALMINLINPGEKIQEIMPIVTALA